ncbi:hypothetical protein NT05LI_1601, partial [Listeria ivanovii FSL F6-596]
KVFNFCREYKVCGFFAVKKLGVDSFYEMLDYLT